MRKFNGFQVCTWIFAKAYILTSKLNGAYGFTVAKRDRLSLAERMLYHFSLYVTFSTILMKLHFFRNRIKLQSIDINIEIFF